MLSRNELKILMNECRERCVSIFMPSHRMGDTQQDPIRFKNLLRKAEELLIRNGLRPPDARKMLDPAERLVRNLFFKEHQSDGFAMFISEGVFLYYWLPVRFDELVTVNERFYVKPLLKLFSADGKFYLLCLSQDAVRLFQGSRFTMNEMKLHNIPDSLGTANRYGIWEKWATVKGTANSNALQGLRGIHGLKGTKGAQSYSYVVSGHGYGMDDRDPELFHYFRMIDKGLRHFLGGANYPLLLAGVEYLLPLYRDANTYPYLIDEGIRGNPEGLKEEELHRKAWDILEPHFTRSQKEALERYLRFSGSAPQLISSDIRNIIVAAEGGRVDTLFVAQDTQYWGKYDAAAPAVYLHAGEEPGDEDLLDLASMHTLLHSGTVYTLNAHKLPGRVPAAAIFRY
ncbi:MAG: baeRF3 domain-containing protein [Endomicrobiales bacterium]